MMNIEAIKRAIYSKGLIYTGLLIGCFVCYSIIMNNGYKAGIVVGCMPFFLICLFYLFKRPYITFALLFVINYFIMGINRYFYFPVWMITDSLFTFILAALIFKTSYENTSWKQINTGMFWSSLIWFLYCLLELTNIHGTTLVDWFQSVRGMAIYPLLTVIFVSLLLNRYKNIQWFLIVWALFTILAGAKGYWQKNHGFDSTELAWLFSGGGRTHLIISGIRFFSFFTDAGNYGSSMGFSMVTFFISALFIKNKWLKIYLIIAGLAGGYGMLISGTRGALAVPFAGLTLFIFLSKKVQFTIGGITAIILALYILMLTDIGNNNPIIRRMRTAFDTNDPSLQTRLTNQAKMQKAMKRLPLGIGIGADIYSPITSQNRVIVNTPTDSWLVRIWTRTGIVGLIIYLSIWGYIILYGSYIVLFKIKNKELRGVLTAMLCGTFGMMCSAWGNEIYTQYPNCILIYTCQTLVFLGPYFDKQISKKENYNKLELTNDLKTA